MKYNFNFGDGWVYNGSRYHNIGLKHLHMIFKLVLFYFCTIWGPEHYLVFMTMFTARLNFVSSVDDHQPHKERCAVVVDGDDHLP